MSLLKVNIAFLSSFRISPALPGPLSDNMAGFMGGITDHGTDQHTEFLQLGGEKEGCEISCRDKGLIAG
jgi:hypothetical protein